MFIEVSKYAAYLTFVDRPLHPRLHLSALHLYVSYFFGTIKLFFSKLYVLYSE